MTEELASVHDLAEGKARRSRRRNQGEPFPDPLPLDLVVRAMKLARIDGYTFAELMFSARTVLYWSNGGDKEGHIVYKVDWAMTIVNSMRLGWGLRGFKAWRSKNNLKSWMDKPLRQFLWDDLVTCVERRRRGDKKFLPRTRVESISDPRLS
jgi:hypothetical protein